MKPTDESEEGSTHGADESVSLLAALDALEPFEEQRLAEEWLASEPELWQEDISQADDPVANKI